MCRASRSARPNRGPHHAVMTTRGGTKSRITYIVRVQEVQAPRDVQRNGLPAAVPPQLPVRVIIQRFPQVATLQPVKQPSGIS